MVSIRSARGARMAVLSSLALALAACAGTPRAAEAAAEAWSDLDDTLLIHSGGLEAWLPDARDEGLKRALLLLDERLLELPAELGGGAPPPGLIDFVCTALRAPWTLRAKLLERGTGASPFPVQAQWTVHTGSPEAAEAMESQLAGLVALSGMPTTSAPEHPELLALATPVGSLVFGARASSFLLAWGEPHDEPQQLGALGLPAGVTPSFAVALDLAELIGKVLEWMPEDEPQSAILRRQMEFLGLVGGEPLRMQLAAGHHRGRALLSGRYLNWASAARRMGALAEEPLSAEALRMVPADATFVSLAKLEPGYVLRSLDVLGEEQVGAVLAQLEALIGVSLDADLLTPLGSTTCVYLSDTTGGGGLASAVALVTLDDEAHFQQTLDTLAGKLNEFGGLQAEGRVRVRAFQHGATRCLGLEFPGLPVPFAPALAVAHGHLFVGATVQALEAALDHAASGARGMYGHAELRAAASGSGLQSLFYSNTPRMAREGYGAAGLLAAALSNAVRSPADALRDAGPVLPPFATLMEGGRETILVSRLVGEDLLTTGESDGSALFQLSATLGWVQNLGGGALLLAGLGAAMVGQASSELEFDDADFHDGDFHSAETAQAQTDVYELWFALENYALNNQGSYPDSLDVLVAPDENGQTYLNRNALPLDPWGNPYIYEAGDSPRVLSYGADGLPGGEGEAADIASDYSADEELLEDWDWEEFENELPEEDG